MIGKNADTCRVGLALYDFNCITGTGTCTFGQELAKALVNLEQSVIDYKVLLNPDTKPETIGLNNEVCLNAPAPKYTLSAKIRRRSNLILHQTIDRIRKQLGMKPTLQYLGKVWVKDWLRSLDLDLLYFPTGWWYELMLDIPIVVTLHDMQHVHYPDWWQSDADKFQRETVFGWFRDHAKRIACSFNYVAADLEQHLNMPRERLSIIFFAPPSMPQVDEIDLSLVRQKYNLPDRYFIYPAATWPHKNHLNLVRAIARCVAAGIDCFCVCTGENAEWLYPGQYEKIKQEIHKLGIEKNISFTGCIPYPELRVLQRGADFFCIPTFYEGGAYPVWEACVLGKAVACSDVTCIPYQIRDAGLLFDPHSPEDISHAIALLWQDAGLRSQLGCKAQKLVDSSFTSIATTALGYHRAFVNCLIELGKLPQSFWIDEDPAPPLDQGPPPPRFEWRKLIKLDAIASNRASN